MIMKYYRLNQIAMAVLFALLLFFGARTIIDIVYKEHEPEKPGMEVATGEAEKPKEAEAPGGAPAEGGSEVVALLASADPARGETAAALCKICHSFDKGQPSPMGPPLYGVVGRKIGSVEGFNYSPALKGKEGDWDYAHIDAMIHNPQAFAPGTMMAFPGVPDAKQRADIIAFLRTKSDSPPPLPEAGAAAPAAEEGAPAEEEATPAEEEAAPAEPEEAPAEEETAPTEMEEEAPPAQVPEEAAPEEEPAEEAPLAAEPEEPSVTHEPAADEVMEEGREEIIVNPPTVSEDAPSEPSMGEPPSPSQPQPAYPDEEAPLAAEPEEPSVTHEPAADEVMEEGREEIIVNPPTVSEDAPSEPSMGEPPSPSQPEPVHPDGPADDTTGAVAPMEAADDDYLSSQPQPVYPDGAP